MGKIEDLATNYARHISLPWQQSVTGAQRVMLLVYDKEDDRKLTARIGEFEIKTREAGHEWMVFDCTTTFSDWISGDEYHEAYFESPEDIKMKIEGEFVNNIVSPLREKLQNANDNTVVAVTGVASLYGFAHVSEIVRKVELDIRGRLVIFFPGTKDGNNYRFLDSRDGWNYLAIGITAHSTGGVT